jgi:hypothetical protein
MQITQSRTYGWMERASEQDALAAEKQRTGNVWKKELTKTPLSAQLSVPIIRLHPVVTPREALM